MENKNKKRPFYFGSDADGKTIVLGRSKGTIHRVFIDGRRQFAKRDFASALHRFGNVNEIKNRDYKKAVKELFSEVK